MFVPTLTALAAVLALSQTVPAQMQLVLQAAPAVTDAENVPVFIPAQEELLAEQGGATTEPVIVAEPGLPDNVEVLQASPDPIVPIIEVDEAPAPVATPPMREELSDAEKADILEKARIALSAAKTAKGRFTQENSDGTTMTGEFALRRPGRVRFDYDAPTPLLIVSDGVTVAMEERELETIDRYPLASTPLGLILDAELSFGDRVDVLRVNEFDQAVTITISDATGEVEGELTMIFDKATYALMGWSTINLSLQMTNIELEQVETNGRIDPRLFRLDNAEDEEDER